jgi:hypothetical protein
VGGSGIGKHFVVLCWCNNRPRYQAEIEDGPRERHKIGRSTDAKKGHQNMHYSHSRAKPHGTAIMQLMTQSTTAFTV